MVMRWFWVGADMYELSAAEMIYVYMRGFAGLVIPLEG
jgi:hypothetical protein